MFVFGFHSSFFFGHTDKQRQRQTTATTTMFMMMNNNSAKLSNYHYCLLKLENRQKRFRYRRIWRICIWSLSAIFLFTMFIHSLLLTIDDDDHDHSSSSSSIHSSLCNLNRNHHHHRKSLPMANINDTDRLSFNFFIIRKLLTSSSSSSPIDDDNDGSSMIKDPKFPPDLFTEKQRRNGAIIFHIIGMIYMFVALAIVCDEFFIPSLDVITEKLAISEDVAGATFMVKLFTSIIGVFISFDDVGIGTIVGSAVFNILFVLSMCAIFSKNVLDLTWWPLFRDVSFYSLILITLVIFFIDSTIFWYEALILLTWYAAYVIFMKFNESIEQFVKRIINGAKVNNNGNDDVMNIPSNYQFKRKSSTPMLHGGTKFRQGLLQLMIHSIDPLYEEPLQMAQTNIIDGNTMSSTTTTTIASKSHIHPPGAAYCPICGEDKHQIKLDSNGIFHTHDHHQYQQQQQQQQQQQNNGNSNYHHYDDDDDQNHKDGIIIIDNYHHHHQNNNNNNAHNNNNNQTVNGNHLSHQDTITGTENNDVPLDVSWPETLRERLTYCLLAPIIIPLWLTLPDVRRADKRKWFTITFIGSIMWIGLYSYFMVWWATLVGDTFRIPSEIMGLTFLAAGTSIPDLITSVLVARKGLGDMAVSSSIGSNIFDVAVGLPFPWLIYTILFGQVNVNSSGMICSVILLFLMLLFVIITIAAFKWRLNISMAAVMFALYFFFIACSLMLENDVIKCSSIINIFAF
ncbi:sodium/potassium/calcium exchanger 2-like isoform X3 [Dermatophagoides farinae]|uniref:sodium/potassium/calcium exchanger 2-like isoform X3 n=2 Tax=Dermatophagoides farinae TaxID=6954 RepID=UPI003F62B3FA